MRFGAQCGSRLRSTEVAGILRRHRITRMLEGTQRLSHSRY